jgi:type II secretory pathway pseudopilin PulG
MLDIVHYFFCISVLAYAFLLEWFVLTLFFERYEQSFIANTLSYKLQEKSYRLQHKTNQSNPPDNSNNSQTRPTSTNNNNTYTKVLLFAIVRINWICWLPYECQKLLSLFVILVIRTTCTHHGRSVYQDLGRFIG